MKASAILPRVALALALIALTRPISLSGETAPTADPATDFPGLRVETTRATDGSKIVTMTVDTDVPKVEVYLDGTYKGHSPLTLKDIPPGIRQLTLKKDGFLSCRYTIECKPGETKKVYAELVRAEGTLSV
ncbi:MAG TPA: PEGA domain-containing protein, partial [Treponemataceae bacterium]|nr:PEGA domain-containing protein [Treponemataceae bacterium]